VAHSGAGWLIWVRRGSVRCGVARSGAACISSGAAWLIRVRRGSVRVRRGSVRVRRGSVRVRRGSDGWLRRSSDGCASGCCTLNIRPGTPRLDIRRYFYSQRIVESWNNVPLDIKKSVSVTAFKNAYRRHRDDMIAPA
jgi:hypothetical protein